MKKTFFAALFSVFLLSIYFSSQASFPNYPRKQATINNHTLTLIVADTEQRKITGLSGAARLKNNEGMLFTFKTIDRYGFWMKDMKYALDFIYLRDNKIIEILKNVKPDSYPHVFISKNKFNSLIEVNAGTVDKLRLQVGNMLRYN